MTDAEKVICSLDAQADFADKMASTSGKIWRKMAKTAAEARDIIDQLLRDLDAMERVRDGRAGKIIRRGVVMINIDWWKRLLEAEEKNLSAAVAASPLSGETRGEAAGWISIEDRLPEEYTHVLVCEECHVDYPDAGMFNVKRSLVKEGFWSRGFDGGKGRGWYFCIQPDMAKEISGVTHWMPLPEPPEEYKNEND